MRTIGAVFVFLVLPWGSAIVPLRAEEALVLVDAGRPNAVVVLSEAPSTAARLGARILEAHVLQMTGARLETIPENRIATGGEDEARVRILIGESESAAELGVRAAGLGPGGIVIRTVPEANAIVILGADNLAPVDSNGTRYAVTTFLEDACGVRFLWPGELGKVVPERETIEVAAMDIRMTPRLTQRKIRMSGGWGDRMAKGGERLDVDGEDFQTFREAAAATHSEDAGWAGWHRLGGSLRLAAGHSFGDYWERFGESHQVDSPSIRISTPLRTGSS